jgi:hypothetical protein
VRRVPAALAVAMVAFCSVGCAQIYAETTTAKALTAAGYDDVDVTVSTVDGASTVAVRWKTEAVDALGRAGEFAAVRRLVWTTTPAEVDTLLLTVEGPPAVLGAPSLTQTTPKRLLTRELGPRPAGLDTAASRHVRRRVVLAAVLAVVAVGIGAAVGMGRSRLRASEGV